MVKVNGCMHNATDVHHTYAGSNRDAFYLVQSTWKAVCRNCHNWVHENPAKARELGYLK
jgi:predicted HNH restriction endonuclease